MSIEEFNKITFVPDTSHETYFPWDDVMLCFDNRLPNYVGWKKCPKCGLESEKLIWIEFNSPPWTWKHLCGSRGPLSICPNCRIQVDFIVTAIN